MFAILHATCYSTQYTACDSEQLARKMAMPLGGSGRAKTSPVWNHFTYDQESNESVCTIRNKDKECGARVKGSYNPTLYVTNSLLRHALFHVTKKLTKTVEN